jgi:SAM-dependent methyltransferase
VTASIRIETAKPVAYDSPDHLEPWGTARDNSVDRRFNRKLFHYLPPHRLRVLDIGCAGGGFVKSVLDAGGFAVGIEGSDYSRKHRRAEWATIPGHLFTADATEPFRLLETTNGQDRPLRFNVVTAWEFFEHIAEEGLAGVVGNIQNHLDRPGIVLASIAPYEDIVNDVRLHQCVHEKDWWVATFARLGLQRLEAVERYFHFDWVRGGPGHASFTIALGRVRGSAAEPERLRLFTRLYTPYEALRHLRRWARRHQPAAAAPFSASAANEESSHHASGQ